LKGILGNVNGAVATAELQNRSIGGTTFTMLWFDE
jgi:hypothetical protein